MNSLVKVDNRIMPMSDSAVDMVYKLEAHTRKMDQIRIHTHHVIHGGMYVRTILIPAGTILTGALVKIPTTLIICGDVVVYIGGEANPMVGYNVLAASAHRKQAFVTIKDTWVTMAFPTTSTNIEEAEKEFTDESDLLLSHTDDTMNTILITGEL